MPRRITGFMAAAALQVVALVLAHDLVYLVRFGSRYGEALVHTGHGESWSTAVGTTLALAGLLFVAGIARLAQLGILVERARATSERHSDAIPAAALDVRQLARIWLRIAPRMALVGVILLTVQENLERSALGGPGAGPGILLSAEYPWALWITIAVGLLVGLVAALFEWRRLALLERLRAARAPAPAAPGHRRAAPPRGSAPACRVRSGPPIRPPGAAAAEPRLARPPPPGEAARSGLPTPASAALAEPAHGPFLRSGRKSCAPLVASGPSRPSRSLPRRSRPHPRHPHTRTSTSANTSSRSAGHVEPTYVGRAERRRGHHRRPRRGTGYRPRCRRHHRRRLDRRPVDRGAAARAGVRRRRLRHARPVRGRPPADGPGRVHVPVRRLAARGDR